MSFFSSFIVQKTWIDRGDFFLSLNHEKCFNSCYENDKKWLKNCSLKNRDKDSCLTTYFSSNHFFRGKVGIRNSFFKTVHSPHGSRAFFHIKSRNILTRHSDQSIYSFSLKSIPNNRGYYSKEEALLLNTSGFFGRLKIHMKYCLMKQIRPFNIDDISAMFTWLIACNILWIIVGTTTFFSLVLAAINSVSAQEYLATKIGKYLTKETGITVTFESAIVPKWRDGTISFKNVYISRSSYNQNIKNNVRKGTISKAPRVIAKEDINIENSCSEENSNYVLFDLTVEDISVVFSFVKWFNGTGIIKDIDIKGVRGVIDASKVYTDEENFPYDPKLFRGNHQLGDFEIENFRLKNVLVTIHQSRKFRPFNVSIYNCELPKLRKQWLLYDILNANTISGSYDNSLFTLHPCQTVSHELTKNGEMFKRTRLRVDNVNIDHLNEGVDGPFGWITRGYVDFILDFVFPNGTKNDDFKKVMHNIVGSIEATLIQQENQEKKRSFISLNLVNGIIPELLRKLTQYKNYHDLQITSTEEMTIDIKMILHGVKANVPLFAKELSYVSNAFIRPIVAYINSHHACIPITCKVIKNLDDFNGSWTIYDSGLMNDLSKEIYEAFAKMVVDQDIKRHCIRTVSAWSLEMAVHAILSSLKGIISSF
ncbi:uncharacterized protein T551_02963 [Pneumocystis jirovecii RU7]|uniref:Mitochondrial distribution and morphology protein 31 n=1 Tax=Pneumocystis jirovecii (strain RU7) TaxID=1408657 RepID=A0A0W4ZGG0_PNEJ7|nr:uncharacterized protein T551_02963 [Pneumocystis jirovecii RU7]KTW27464.1 hypothetical protein T551_02963 [Pneumocystis jirovecii RU7]